MAGYIEDRWLNKRPDKETGKRKRTDRYGKGKRYKVAGIPGVKPALFDALEDAKKWMAKAIAKSNEGNWIDPRAGDITLRDYVDKHWWPSLRKPPSTKEGMERRIRNQLLPHLGYLRLRQITTDEVNAWVVALSDEIGQGTIRTCWMDLSSILQSAKEAKRIGDNPCRGYDTARPPKKPPQKARRWEVDRVMAVKDALPERYRLLVDLGTGAGLRQGEAFGLSQDDLRDGEIYVERQVLRIRSKLAFGPPKGNKERSVKIPDVLAERVQQHAERFKPVKVTLPWVDPDEPNMPWERRPLVTVELLVTSQLGGAVNRADWNRLKWKQALGEAGVIEELPEPAGLTQRQRLAWLRNDLTGALRWPEAREQGFHVLRHTFASVQLEAGESIVTLANWLGHGDPAFTLRTYTHFMPTAGSRGMAAMDAWLRGVQPSL